MKNDKKLGQWLTDMNLKHPLTVAGPCSAETEAQVLETARQLSLKNSQVTVFRAGVWKPRTRPGSFEGVGAKALPWLQKVKKETGLLTTIEVANAEHVKLALAHDIDILWIGARTTANPFAVQEIADSLRGTNKIVWIKNPINPDLELWIGAFERVYQAGITKLGAIHRGFSTYNKTNYRNEPQWQIPIDFKSEFPDIPMICDPSHICGKRDCIEHVAQTALDLQYEGLMIETHCNPDKALSDAQQQLKPVDFHKMVSRLTVRQKTFDNEHRDQLRLLRNAIDELDQKLIDVLSERMQLVHQIGLFKKEQNVAIFQNKRFKDVMDKMLTQASITDLSDTFIADVFKAIHQESIRHQEEIVNKTSSDSSKP
ncbi:MAG: 3-deoxy-7-phosphoheptulonate synthase [Flavobacteriia bacterium]|nr:MAG: 3-deoxy-7-phosphoheptulonate synthase [Flavobacteriia bacterium]